jgi:hypothetical protein
MGNFDLLAPRGDVDEISLKRVYNALQENWKESSISLAQRLQLDETIVKSALAIYSQHGQVLYDLAGDVYRVRELSREPLPMDLLRFKNERDRKADNFIRAGLVSVQNRELQAGRLVIEGEVLDNANEFKTKIVIDADQRLESATCQCHFYHSNHLRKGPCEHMLALRKKDSQLIVN